MIVTLKKPLIKSQKPMTWQESKILSFLLSQVVNNEYGEFSSYKFSVPEVRELLALDEDANVNKIMKDISASLLSRIIQVNNSDHPQSWTMFQWMSSARYVSANSKKNKLGYDYIELDLHQNVKTMAVEFAKRFPNRSLAQIIEFDKIPEGKIA